MPDGLTADVYPVNKSIDPLSMVPYLALQKWWSETEAGIETHTTTEIAIAELETRYEIRLPADFREYVSCGLPIAEHMDAEFGSWWCLERIGTIPEKYEGTVYESLARNAAKHLVFLDFCIWSWAWAISCADDEHYGKVALIGGISDGYVANSFTEFVQLYTTDWASVCQVSKAPTPVRRLQGWIRNIVG